MEQAARDAEALSDVRRRATLLQESDGFLLELRREAPIEIPDACHVGRRGE